MREPRHLIINQSSVIKDGDADGDGGNGKGIDTGAIAITSTTIFYLSESGLAVGLGSEK